MDFISRVSLIKHLALVTRNSQSTQQMKYSTYDIVPALLVLLICSITSLATTLGILAHVAVESSLHQPNDGGQKDGSGKVFHTYEGASCANNSQVLSNAK